MSEWSKVAEGDVEERERRGGGPASRDLAGALGAGTMTLRVWRYGPGHEMAYHRHQDQEELYRLISGGPQEVFIEGEVVTVEDGEWLRIPKDTARRSRTARTARRCGSRSARPPASASATASASTPTRARRSPARDAGPVNARILALAALLARKQGAAVAKMLLAQAQAWMADPANEATKRALVEQLTGIAQKAGGAAGRLSSRLAREVDRRKVSVAAWERDLMSLRYEIADMAPGPIRDAAVDAYVAQASAGVHLIDDPGRPEKARDVMRALETEARMLASERLTADERRRTVDAVAAARAACAERGATLARSR